MSTLFKLQFLQLEHDQKFHSDIYNLRPQDKVKHLILHVIKYACKLTTTSYQNESELKRILTDSLVICLSLANAFNIRIDEHVPILKDLPSACTHTLQPAARKLLGSYGEVNNLNQHSPNYGASIIIDLTKLMLGVSKAVEAWDHLEDYPYIQHLRNFIPEYFELILIASEYFGITFIEQNYLTRILGIEGKNQFSTYHQMEMQSWRDEDIQQLLVDGGMRDLLSDMRKRQKTYAERTEHWLKHGFGSVTVIE